MKLRRFWRKQTKPKGTITTIQKIRIEIRPGEGGEDAKLIHK